MRSEGFLFLSGDLEGTPCSPRRSFHDRARLRAVAHDREVPDALCHCDLCGSGWCGTFLVSLCREDWWRACSVGRVWLPWGLAGSTWFGWCVVSPCLWCASHGVCLVALCRGDWRQARVWCRCTIGIREGVRTVGVRVVWGCVVSPRRWDLRRASRVGCVWWRCAGGFCGERVVSSAVCCMSSRVTSCHVASRRVASRRVASRRVASCRVVSCRVA